MQVAAKNSRNPCAFTVKPYLCKRQNKETTLHLLAIGLVLAIASQAQESNERNTEHLTHHQEKLIHARAL